MGREEALAAVIRASAADLVVLQEATHPGLVERLAAATGMSAWDARPGHSVAYMSRVAVAHHEWHLPLPARRPFLELVLAGGGLRVFGVHLTAVHSNWTERRRARELRGLLEGIAAHRGGFHLVTGDFNTLAPGEELDVGRLPYRLRAVLWLTGRTIRWQTIGIMLDAGYVDGYRRLNASDAGYTFPTWDPHVRLDYAFVPASFVDRVEECRVVDAPAGAVAAASDHRPLLASVRV